jgi:hypothetical protein
MYGEVEWPVRQQSVQFAGTCCKQFQFQFGRLGTFLATEVVETLSTPPSTTIAIPAKLVVGRRRQNKQRGSRKPFTLRSIDWKLDDSIFEPLHARFDFTLEGCANDVGLNSQSDLHLFSPSDSIMERDLSGEREFISPPWELAKHFDSHFESCKRIAPTSTMDVFVPPK